MEVGVEDGGKSLTTVICGGEADTPASEDHRGPIESPLTHNANMWRRSRDACERINESASRTIGHQSDHITNSTTVIDRSEAR